MKGAQQFNQDKALLTSGGRWHRLTLTSGERAVRTAILKPSKQVNATIQPAGRHTPNLSNLSYLGVAERKELVRQ
jgi:hypothetical protein